MCAHWITAFLDATIIKILCPMNFGIFSSNILEYSFVTNFKKIRGSLKSNWYCEFFVWPEIISKVLDTLQYFSLIEKWFFTGVPVVIFSRLTQFVTGTVLFVLYIHPLITGNLPILDHYTFKWQVFKYSCLVINIMYWTWKFIKLPMYYFAVWYVTFDSHLFSCFRLFHSYTHCCCIRWFNCFTNW